MTINPPRLILLSLAFFTAYAFATGPATTKKRKPRPTYTPVNPFAASNPYFPTDPHAAAKPNVIANPYFPTGRSKMRNPSTLVDPAQTSKPSLSTPPSGLAPNGSPGSTPGQNPQPPQ